MDKSLNKGMFNKFESRKICVAGYQSGASNDNFWKISVRKTIWDLEFSEHLLLNFLFACLS